jgi:cation diffusion facilitator family transporter
MKVQMMDTGARMKCASARCGLVSPGALAEDAAQRALSSQKLGKAVVFCLIFMVVETVGGVLANSLAILADAAHLLSDIAGFVISLCAICAAGWEATPSQSFGFYRLEILGALLSIQLIWLLTGILVYEAIRRLFDPSQLVDGRLMFGIASVGLLVNLAMIFMLGHDSACVGGLDTKRRSDDRGCTDLVQSKLADHRLGLYPFVLVAGVGNHHSDAAQHRGDFDGDYPMRDRCCRYGERFV